MAKSKINFNSKHGSEEQEAKQLALIIFGILLFLGIIYLVTYILVNKGVLSKGYEKPVVTAAVIDYETATIGTVFTKPDKEYYVLFDYFTNSIKKSSYLESMLSIYKDRDDSLQIYKVDLNKTINEEYISDTANIKVQASKDLKIKGVTLIKIKSGKNVLYLDDIDRIAEELKVETE